MFLSFCDLDLTLIQTSRHLNDNEPREVVYTSSSGKEITITPKQKALFNLLNDKEHYVIPVTARSLESLKRVEDTLAFASFKVCNYGIFIYDYIDELIPQFTDSLIGKVSHAQSDLKDIIKYLHTHNVQSKLISYKHYGFYIEGNINNKSTDLLKLNQIIRKYKDFDLYVNGTGFALFPKTLKPKVDAVRYIKKRTYLERQDLTTIGIGDSTSDLAFMSECDFLMIPTKSNVQIIKEFFL